MPVSASPPPDRSSRRRIAVTGALIGAAVALAALAVGRHVAESAERRDVLARFAAVAVEVGDADRAQVRREDDPAWRRMVAARVLVGREMLPQTVAGNPAAAVARLEVAAALAAEAAAARPLAWEAPMLLGAATYLARRRAGDPRLVTAAADWERPLARARELAPTAAEPASFSALAYLELWPGLSEEKRRLALDLLARAFRGKHQFLQLLPLLIDLVDDPAEAMAVIPDDVPAAWSTAETAFAERGDWASAVEARRRGREALRRDLERRLDEAARIARRDPARARGTALGTIAAAPVDLGFVPLVERALAEAPPGPALPSPAPAMRRWLDWALDLALVGRQPFALRRLERLAGLAGELPPPVAARAALAAGRPAAARRLEAEAAASGTARGPGWATYRLAKVGALLAAGEARQAAATLAAIEPAWRRGPLHDHLATRVAAATGDPAAATAAARRLDALGGAVDPLHPLASTDRSVRFALPSGAPVAGLAVEIGEGDPGTLLAVHLDGRLVEIARARPGRRLELAATAPAGLHLVEVTALRGRGTALRSLAAVPRAGGGAADDGEGEGVRR